MPTGEGSGPKELPKGEAPPVVNVEKDRPVVELERHEMDPYLRLRLVLNEHGSRIRKGNTLVSIERMLKAGELREEAR